MGCHGLGPHKSPCWAVELGRGMAFLGVSHRRHTSVSQLTSSRGAWLVEQEGGGRLTNLLNSLLSSCLVSH